MAVFPVDTAVTGAGDNSQAQNVFKIEFSQDLAGPPVLEAWSNSALALNVANATLANKDVGVFMDTSAPYGATTPDDSCVYAIPTKDVPAIALWASVGIGDDVGTYGTKFSADSYRAGGKVLAGTHSALRLTDSGLAADWILDTTFNISYRVGHQASTVATDHNFVLACRYIYTGADPTPVWKANHGTEGTPTWDDVAGGAAVLGDARKAVHANATADPSNPVITRPASGRIWSEQIVIQQG